MAKWQPNRQTKTNPWTKFHGPNLGYVVEQYDRYINNEESVDPELIELFLSNGVHLWIFKISKKEAGQAPPSFNNTTNMEIILKMVKLFEDIRRHGHLAASINPLAEQKNNHPLLQPEKNMV
ncbi:hypothetical protein GCM10020331_090480 [Ectobacillus funiculus]